VTKEPQNKMSHVIQAKSRWVKDPAEREVQILEDHHALRIARDCRCGMPEVYREALSLGIYPHRYLRNRNVISPEEQLRLARSRAAVVGAGGLGGHVVLLLARIGIGHLVVVDRDVFDETNLNRQALCTKHTIGSPKAEEALRQIADINPGVEVTSYSVTIDPSNIEAILAGSHVIVDALDNVRDRFLLEQGAKTLRIPLVHGALAGFEGQLMTVFPDDRGLRLIYGDAIAAKKDPKSPEAILGVPALMPSMIATLQAMEVLKIILGRGKLFRNTLLHVDLEAGELNHFVFPSSDG
jgi:molybdopterin/thiamine biosynthesis adenylyltransferase